MVQNELLFLPQIIPSKHPTKFIVYKTKTNHDTHVSVKALAIVQLSSVSSIKHAMKVVQYRIVFYMKLEIEKLRGSLVVSSTCPRPDFGAT